MFEFFDGVNIWTRDNTASPVFSVDRFRTTERRIYFTSVILGKGLRGDQILQAMQCASSEFSKATFTMGQYARKRNTFGAQTCCFWNHCAGSRRQGSKNPAYKGHAGRLDTPRNFEDSSSWRGCRVAEAGLVIEDCVGGIIRELGLAALGDAMCKPKLAYLTSLNLRPKIGNQKVMSVVMGFSLGCVSCQHWETPWSKFHTWGNRQQGFPAFDHWLIWCTSSEALVLGVNHWNSDV
jgi:hypothetical protein